MDITKLIVVEYSVKQKAFHSHTVKSMLETNIENSLLGVETDYIPIGLFETKNEADEYLNSIKTKIRPE